MTDRWRGRRRGVLLAGAAVPVLAVVLGLVVTGIGGVGGTEASDSGTSVAARPVVPYPPASDRAAPEPAQAPAAPEDAQAPAALEAPKAGESLEAAGAGRSSAKSGAGTVPPDVAPDRSVIRTARLTLDVRDLPGASAAVRDTAASVGGFVAAEHTVDRWSSFTLRVPSGRLDEVMARLAGTGTVTERYGQAEDVTDQMVDLESRLTTQRASVARVRALLERADTVGEVVAVESELAAREAELESLQRRLASVGGRVSMSTLTVALHPVPPVAAPEPGNGFLAGLATGWRAFVAATGGLLTALGALLPFAVALAVLLGGALLVRRAVRRHRAAEAALAAVPGGSGKS